MRFNQGYFPIDKSLSHTYNYLDIYLIIFMVVEMENSNQNNELLAFFKALADANRLKIIGLLANQATSVEKLAEQLDLTAATVSHHLSRLAECGLVSAKAEGYYSIYSLQTNTLESLAKRLLTRENLPSLARGCGCGSL